MKWTVLNKAATRWAGCISRRAGLICMASLIITMLAFQHMKTLNVSTQINALMPEGARSVRTLNKALEKTGSFAAIQIVANANSPDAVLAQLGAIKKQIDTYDWVGSSQYYEDIEVLENHKLLYLSLEELLELEAEINQAYPTLIAKNIGAFFGASVRYTERGAGLTGESTSQIDPDMLEAFKSITDTSKSNSKRYFTSDDGLTGVLIVWPKAGQDSLLDAKRMVDDSYRLIDRLNTTPEDKVALGVGGRIASQVAQFESITRDLKYGLISAIGLIILMLLFAYRSFMAIPIILIPLGCGIIITLGLTAIIIGNLNLITVFLTLILFGLGIDFAIHNFSRYQEERRKGHSQERAVQIIIHDTGAASLLAATTTALAFFALIFTEFRAFSEFGIIAGIGILIICLSMYTLQPALIVLADRIGWTINPRSKKQKLFRYRWGFNPLRYRLPILTAVIITAVSAAYFAPKIKFETDTKKLEAQMPARHVTATEQIQKVIRTGNSRAIIVAENYDDLVKIDEYFKHKIKEDDASPTIKSVSSLIDFIPNKASQLERLAIIKRLAKSAYNLRVFDPETYESSLKFLTIEALNIADLPPGLRRTYLGQSTGSQQNDFEDRDTDYLVYVDNAVNLDDARNAKAFSDDVAQFTIDGQNHYAASESFILVEMLGLMKADAIKAILLVSVTTSFVVFIFLRNFWATLIVLAPTLIGLAATVAIMGAFGPALSIMNMVILPSLIGISVDNGIHIFHRFESEGPDADILGIMSTTGRASVLTTLTTLIGFGGMITASMAGLRSLALLAIIGFLACLITTGFVLPILLEFYQKHFQRKRLQPLGSAL
ncbi:putative RND superfamily exporter protein [Litorimonas taeanensis]|uniref:Putative RND superfamily exporter protein n=1 Tax=Litorimonas taeanensis TaxID=568099 RepID=A0A420WLX7_9PROT|nr:MMPL family transporter [Litorimonas taeanensis]RKQ72038.1 putative RND superfamily exporter protein [Litorimonas taeanensis]